MRPSPYLTVWKSRSKNVKPRLTLSSPETFSLSFQERKHLMLPPKGKQETLSTDKNVTNSTSHLTSSLNGSHYWITIMMTRKRATPLIFSLPCLPLWQTLHTLKGNFASSQFLSITTTGLDHVLSLCTSHRSSFTTFNIHTLHVLNLKMEAACSFQSLPATNTTHHITKDQKLKYCSKSTSLNCFMTQ